MTSSRRIVYLLVSLSLPLSLIQHDHFEDNQESSQDASAGREVISHYSSG